MIRIRHIAAAGLMALAAMKLVGCSPTPTQTDAIPPENATAPERAAPPPAPAPEQPNTPPEAGPLEANAGTAPRFDEALLARIRRGMSPEAVAQITGTGGNAIGGDGDSVQVLQYVDDSGNSFTARFDDGALRTRSGLRQPGGQEPPKRAAARTAPPEKTGDRPLAEIAPGVYVPLERAVAASTGQPRGVTRAPRPPQSNAEAPPIRWRPPDPTASEEAASPARGPEIAVAGRSRQGRNPADAPPDRSYQPRASLPDFTRSIREGDYELRFQNPGQSPVTVGLRQGKLGRNAEIPAGKSASFHVDRGTYALYFLRESEPYTLYEADPITIDGFRTTDLEIQLDPGDVRIQLIDYGQPE